MKIKVADLVLVALLLALCFTPLFFLGDSGKTVTISAEGRLLTTLSLEGDSRYDIPHCGTVVIEKGRVRFENASCPDLSCEKTGEIHLAGQTIICLPNRVVIRIDGEREVDAVAE